MSVEYIIVLREFFSEKYYFSKKGEFEKIEGKMIDLLRSALTFNNYDNARQYCENNDFVFKNEDIEAFPEVSNLLIENKIDIRAVMTRKPENLFFDLEDVRRVIYEGNDSYNNSIVVNYDGIVKLHRWNKLTDIYRYAASNGEVFAAGNGYIGQRAASDSEFVKNEYTRLIHAWGASIAHEGKFVRGLDYNDSSIDVNKVKKSIKENIEKIFE